MASELDRAIIFDFNHEDCYALVADDIIVGSPGQLWGSLHRDTFRIVYRPLLYDEASQKCVGFDWVCRLAWARGDLWLIVDEAHELCIPQRIPPSFQRIARRGRHQQVSLLYITQSFAAIEGSLTRNTNTFYFFKIIHPGDLEGIRKRCGEETAKAVQSLRKLDALAGVPGEVLKWSDSGEVVRSTSDKIFPLTSFGPSDTRHRHDQVADSRSPGQPANLRNDGTGNPVPPEEQGSPEHSTSPALPSPNAEEIPSS
jgi:hypothetical protein